jgi:hypothetical protein
MAYDVELCLSGPKDSYGAELVETNRVNLSLTLLVIRSPLSKVSDFGRAVCYSGSPDQHFHKPDQRSFLT